MYEPCETDLVSQVKEAVGGAVNETRQYTGYGDTEIFYIGGYNLQFERGETGGKEVSVDDVLANIVESHTDYETAVIVSANDTTDTAEATIYRGGEEVGYVFEEHIPEAPIPVFGMIQAYLQREYGMVVPVENALYIEEHHEEFEHLSPINEEKVTDWLETNSNVLVTN